MLRQLLVIAGILSGTAFFTGCRACSSCHDYDRPVADCDCGTCGCGRAGSVLSGCQDGTCGPNGGAPSGEYVETE